MTTPVPGTEQLDFFEATPDEIRSPIVVSAGIGVDSTAVLVEFARRGIRPDRILFANTGGEKPATLAYRPVLEEWIVAVGFPPLVEVTYRVENPVYGRYETLEQECLLHRKLPALAYGFHQCSAKWKIDPQRRDLKNWEPARTAWKRGLPVIQVIGFDAGPRDSRRCSRLPTDDPRFRYWMPLIDWGWDRERCMEEIRACDLLASIAHRHGVDVSPQKSACYFCPATKAAEVVELQRAHPQLAARAMQMEKNAAPYLTGTTGLFRKPTKDRPGSWTELLTGERLVIGGAEREERTPRASTQPSLLVCGPEL